MAKKNIFRRAVERITTPVKQVVTKTADTVKKTVTKPFQRKPKKITKAPKKVHPPRPAPQVGKPLSPGQKAQSYIDDLASRGKEAHYPTDFSTEDWRAFDERGGTPSLGGGK